jgi:hypothetical protein
MGTSSSAGRAGAAVLLGLLAPAHAWAQSTLVSVSTYGNFHTAGVLVTISGDPQGNAYCNLAYKRAADPTFLPALSFPKIDATHLAGSLFGLSPGTAYDVRVTLVDPDGVSGSPTQTTSVTTRADSFAEPSVQTLYVATSGNDNNPGTAALPLRTIGRAEALAAPGTLVLIQPGVYREEVTVNVQGTALQPLVFRGNGAGVVLDGADAAIAAGVPWARVIPAASTSTGPPCASASPTTPHPPRTPCTWRASSRVSTSRAALPSCASRTWRSATTAPAASARASTSTA